MSFTRFLALAPKYVAYSDGSVEGPCDKNLALPRRKLSTKEFAVIFFGDMLRANSGMVL